MRRHAATFSWQSIGQRGGVKGGLELIRWINSALNGRSTGFIRVFKAKTAANARRFLRDLNRACPLRIRTILTERAKSAIGPRTMASGKEFTDRLFGLRKATATAQNLRKLAKILPAPQQAQKA